MGKFYDPPNKQTMKGYENIVAFVAISLSTTRVRILTKRHTERIARGVRLYKRTVKRIPKSR